MEWWIPQARKGSYLVNTLHAPYTLHARADGRFTQKLTQTYISNMYIKNEHLKKKCTPNEAATTMVWYLWCKLRQEMMPKPYTALLLKEQSRQT
ncbi:hypothetical protein VTN00DRAFT_666 [Thermoascus crustaceus]|uniref:uncharacterized protein n=1 Tax=Thermoascus crustaceus TaxID=5088 RepID=UPI0037433B6A